MKNTTQITDKELEVDVKLAAEFIDRFGELIRKSYSGWICNAFSLLSLLSCIALFLTVFLGLSSNADQMKLVCIWLMLASMIFLLCYVFFEHFFLKCILKKEGVESKELLRYLLLLDCDGMDAGRKNSLASWIDEMEEKELLCEVNVMDTLSWLKLLRGRAESVVSQQKLQKLNGLYGLKKYQNKVKFPKRPIQPLTVHFNSDICILNSK